MLDNLEVLVVTMNQDARELVEKMNIKTNALIGNQCNANRIDSFIDKNGNKMTTYSFNERGVGLNRNNLLLRTTAEYVVLADDDMVFLEEYDKIVKQAFERHRNADVLIFNLLDEKGKQYHVKKDFRVRTFNCGKFGAARLVIRMDKIRKKAICFNQLFGGGSKYGSGEDTLFLKKCLDEKLKIYAVSDTIARLTYDRPSTWYSGINDKWFIDAGASKAAFSAKFPHVLSLYFLFKHNSLYREKYTIKAAYLLMKKGINEFLK